MKNALLLVVSILVLLTAIRILYQSPDEPLSNAKSIPQNIVADTPHVDGSTSDVSELVEEPSTDIWEISFRDSFQGSAEYLDARTKAEAIITAPGMRTSRYRIVDLDFATLDKLYAAAVDGNDRFEEPVVVKIFDDLPCTISNYRQTSHDEVGLLISATCEEYFGRGSMRITLDPPDKSISVRLYVSSDKYGMVGLDEKYAVVYEYALANNKTRIEERRSQSK